MLQLAHRIGERDSYLWRKTVFLYFVAGICVAAKIIWLLFLNGVWSNYGSMVCAKSSSVHIEVDEHFEQLVSEHEWMGDLLE